MAIRPAQAASTFYPAKAEDLIKQIEDNFLSSLGPGRLPTVNKQDKGSVLGLLSPHAGYIYSGSIAAWSYLGLAEDHSPSKIIIIGPNHTGFGAKVSLFKEGSFLTPLGNVEVGSNLAEKIKTSSDGLIEEDLDAHNYEHSIEVQLPFLQYLFKDHFKIVPICLLDQRFDTAQKLGQAIALALKNEPSFVIVASSDLTHYEAEREANKKDKKALEAIKNLDPKKFNQEVELKHISLCGKGPITAMLTACNILGAKNSQILKYATSGQITGDTRAVVGYGSVIIKRETRDL